MPAFGTGGFNAGFNTTYLTPRVGPGVPTPGMAPELAPAEQDALTQRIFNSTYNENRGISWTRGIAESVAATGIDLGDTVVSSMSQVTPVGMLDSMLGSGKIPGVIQRNDVWNLVGDYGGEVGAELQDYYTRNQSRINLLSGITGAIGTGYLAGELLLPRLASSLASNTAISGSRLWQLGARFNAATRTAMQAGQAEAAMQGEAFAAWQGAGGRYLANRALAGAGKALFEETAIAATMHTNEALYSDDWSTNLMWAGLGVGVGGVVGALGARTFMRQYANSPAMVQKRIDAIDSQGFTAMRENTPMSVAAAHIKSLDAKESSVATSLALESRQATPANALPQLATRLETVRAQATEQLQNSVQKITTKGIPGIPGSRFSIEDASHTAGRHLLSTLHDDPRAIFGADSLGKIRPQEATDKGAPLHAMLTDFDLNVQNLKNTKPRKGIGAISPAQAAEAIQEGNRLGAQQALVLIDNQWLPARSASAMSATGFRPELLQMKQTAKGINEFVFHTDTGIRVKINEGFQPHIGKGPSADFHALPEGERFQIIEATRQLMDKMIKAGDKHVIPKNPTWFQLDAALAFKARGGQVEWQKQGIINADAARLESLKLKKKAIGNTKIGSYWDRVRYNLPKPNTAERIYDSYGDSIRQILDAADQGASLADLETLRTTVLNNDGFDLRGGRPPLDGDMFNFNRDAKGKWKTPVLGMFTTEKVNKPLSQQIIAEANAEVKISKILGMTDTGPWNGMYPGIVPTLVNNIIGAAEYAQSQRIIGLADNAATGLGNAGKQAMAEILTREFRYRDNPTMLSALRTREAMNRMTDEYLFQLTSPLSDVTKKLAAAPGVPSRTLVNQFFSNTAGWDIDEAQKVGDFWQFTLADTPSNRVRLGTSSVSKGTPLINPRTGKEIVLDDLGFEFLGKFNSAANAVLADTNKLRVARGLSEIKSRKFYTPPPDTRNARVGFTFDEENRLVPGGAIVSNSDSEFERLRTEKFANMPKGWTFKTREQIPNTADLHDMAAMDWIHPGVGHAPALGQKGFLASDRVNPNAIDDTLTWLKRQVEQIGTNSMRVLYEQQLGIARARSAVERAVKSIPEDSPLRTIWDEYQMTILGQNLADSQRSISGKLANVVENRINLGLKFVWPGVTYVPDHVGEWIGDIGNRMGVRLGKVESYNDLVTKLSGYSPYKNIDDYLAQNTKIERPPEIRAISQKLNKLSATLVLRYADFPMAAMNMLGIVTTLPSILQSGRAPVSVFMNAGGRKVGIVDSAKILMSSMRDLTRQSRHPDWDFMVKNGDTTQQVADFNKQMSVVNDRGSFGRVFFGDKTSKNFLENKGIDGLLGIATDVTENWSRTWAHFAGLRLADIQGITGLEARHSFAREIANAAIANYNPLNRPELYQSAFGSLFGLFASYMQSYNQRLFRWMETGDYASVGHQLVMQQALFGTASLPGFNAIQASLQSAGALKTEDGEEPNLMDYIYAKLGPTIGSAVAHGGLSELGVALYTRGDMNYRDVTLDPSRLMAGIGIMKQMATGVVEAGQSLMSPNSVENNNRVLEILARNMPNRIMKGVLNQIANGGQEIDAYGQVVSSNRNFFESSLRVLGVRSTYQQSRIEAFYANKAEKDREAARMEDLSQETRALVRNNPKWRDQMMDVFKKYESNGGQPGHFRTWIKDQLRAATNRRDVNDLLKALRSPNNQLAVWRYNAYSPD